MSEPVRTVIGTVVERYGRFELKQWNIFKGDRELPSHQYKIFLKEGDGDEEDIGLLPTQEGTLPGLLTYLHTWVRDRYIDTVIAKRALSQEGKSDEERENIRIHLEGTTDRYTRVVRAIRELEPTYQPDESIPDLPADSEEKETSDPPNNREK